MDKQMNTREVVDLQHRFFAENHTKDVAYRKESLKKLFEVIKQHEEELIEALGKDLGKSRHEAYVTEISQVYSEIKVMLKHIDSWSKPKRAGGNIAMPLASNRVYCEPFGVTLIIVPWNYPVNLSFVPMIGALAAGNTVVLKPSELSVNTSKLIERIINDSFSAEYLHVIDKDTSPDEMWSARYDYIFFTGSPRVGKIVMAEAAKNLTPVTLELGGKSPCFVDQTANLKVAARRIVWGKMLNAGQTCIAPDYILVHADVKKSLIELIQQEIALSYPDALKNPTYPHIISDAHFNRLISLIATEHDVIGGKNDPATRSIEPAIFPNCDWDHEVMQSELFGPLMPVIEYTDLTEVIAKVKDRERPLACYVYTEDRKTARRIIHEISFGSGCVNDCIMQIGSHHLPFGGVGNSGLGQYHGHYSFQTFSHLKSVVDNPTWFDVAVRYAPFTEDKLRLLKKILG